MSTLPFLGWAQELPESVTLGAVLFPPTAQINADTGQCFGRSIARTREIIEHYDMKLNVVCVSAVRIYKMIADGEVDFTINVKSTLALKPHVTFIEKPFSQITLNLYQHAVKKPIGSVAAIRGFDYAGTRQRLESEEIEFIDQPTSISALQVFIRKRSDGLLAYESPVQFYLESRGVELEESVSITPLLNINSHFAVSNHSQHAKALIKTLNHFSQQHTSPYLQRIKTN